MPDISKISVNNVEYDISDDSKINLPSTTVPQGYVPKSNGDGTVTWGTSGSDTSLNLEFTYNATTGEVTTTASPTDIISAFSTKQKVYGYVTVSGPNIIVRVDCIVADSSSIEFVCLMDGYNGFMISASYENNAWSWYGSFNSLKELPSTLGTSGQVLKVNSSASGVEWGDVSGGGTAGDITYDSSATYNNGTVGKELHTHTHKIGNVISIQDEQPTDNDNLIWIDTSDDEAPSGFVTKAYVDAEVEELSEKIVNKVIIDTTQERPIGTYIYMDEGVKKSKPIYVTTILTSTVGEQAHGIQNIDRVVKLDGLMHATCGYDYPEGVCTASDSKYEIGISSSTMYLEAVKNDIIPRGVDYMYVSFYYTKTTDTPTVIE